MRKLYSLLILLLPIFALVGQASFEDNVDAFTISHTNDLVNENGYYRANGNDPYIVFSTDNAVELIIYFQVADRLETTILKPLELFWANNHHGFSEDRRLLIDLNNKDQVFFNVNLGDVAFFAETIEQNTQIRLDLPTGFTNYFQLKVGRALEKPTVEIDVAQAQIIMSSLQPKLPDDSPIQEVNDLVYKDGFLQMYGGDPYLVIDLSKLENHQPGFLEFGLKPLITDSLPAREYAYLEGFWASESHGFNEAYKFVAIIPGMVTGGYYNLNYYDVLDVRENGNAFEVNQLRLDLPYDLNRMYEFSLSKNNEHQPLGVLARFPINPEGLNDLRIYSRSTQGLIQSFFSKLVGDLLFTLSWIALIILIAFWGLMRTQ